MTLQACMDIERRSLAYSRTLEKYRDHGMPWMEKVLSRLPTGLHGDILLQVVTFVSCVGLIMNGFVDYNHLRDLLTHMSHVMSCRSCISSWSTTFINRRNIGSLPYWRNNAKGKDKDYIYIGKLGLLRISKQMVPVCHRPLIFTHQYYTRRLLQEIS